MVSRRPPGCPIPDVLRCRCVVAGGQVSGAEGVFVGAGGAEFAGPLGTPWRATPLSEKRAGQTVGGYAAWSCRWGGVVEVGVPAPVVVGEGVVEDAGADLE